MPRLFREWIQKCGLHNGGHFVSASMCWIPYCRIHTISKCYINGLMQDCCNSILNALAFPQHCGEPYWYIPYKLPFSMTLHPSFQYGAFYYFPIQSIQLHHSTGNFTTCQCPLSDLRHIKILNRTAITSICAVSKSTKSSPTLRLSKPWFHRYLCFNYSMAVPNLISHFFYIFPKCFFIVKKRNLKFWCSCYHAFPGKWKEITCINRNLEKSNQSLMFARANAELLYDILLSS